MSNSAVDVLTTSEPRGYAFASHFDVGWSEYQQVGCSVHTYEDDDPQVWLRFDAAVSVGLPLTPAQARRIAAALVDAANAVDPAALAAAEVTNG